MFALHSSGRLLFYGFRSFFLRTAYTDHLRVGGDRLALAYAWMARVMDILRTRPRAKREPYSWVLGEAPSGSDVSTALLRMRQLIRSRIRDLKVAVAAMGGKVLRAVCLFKAPRRILSKNGEEGAGRIRAIVGSGDSLLDELQIYHSVSCAAYINGARLVSHGRFFDGMRPPRIIVGNSLSRGGGLIKSNWEGEPKAILADYPSAPPNLAYGRNS